MTGNNITDRIRKETKTLLQNNLETVTNEIYQGVTPNRPSKFRAKNWVKINDDSRGKCNTPSQIKFRTSMLKSGLGDYSDTYILVKETISVANKKYMEVIIKSCSPFTDCITIIHKYTNKQYTNR